MNKDCAAVREDLPFFAAGSLEPGRRDAVASHLHGCADCRRELAIWSAAGSYIATIDRALPAPPADALEGALATIRADAARVSIPARLWLIIKSQVPLVRREIWLASALVIIMGCALSLGLHRGSPEFLVVLAPIVSAAGVAMIYGTDNDPALELTLATPTAPRQVLLTRLFLVFGYDLILAIAGSAVLATWGAWSGALGELVMSWLAPMTFLSALALVLSVWIGAGNAAVVSFFIWAATWQARLFRVQFRAEEGWQPLVGAVMALEQFRGQGMLQLALAAMLFALAVWLVGRPTTLGDARLA